MPALAQAPVDTREPTRCASVVVVRCERSEASSPPRHDAARRFEERRRNGLDPLELERIVIEGEPIPRSLESTLSSAFRKPAWGTTTVATGEGSQCTCMNVCPPLPFPCCACSAPPARYSSSPGSSPVN